MVLKLKYELKRCPCPKLAGWLYQYADDWGMLHHTLADFSVWVSEAAIYPEGISERTNLRVQAAIQMAVRTGTVSIRAKVAFVAIGAPPTLAAGWAGGMDVSQADLTMEPGRPRAALGRPKKTAAYRPPVWEGWGLFEPDPEAFNVDALQEEYEFELSRTSWALPNQTIARWADKAFVDVVAKIFGNDCSPRCAILAIARVSGVLFQFGEDTKTTRQNVVRYIGQSLCHAGTKTQHLRCWVVNGWEAQQEEKEE